MPLLCQRRSIADALSQPRARCQRCRTSLAGNLDLLIVLRDDRRVFKDRIQAGGGLAAALPDLRGRSNVTLIGLAKGGVVVAAEMARLLRLPMDVLCVKKVAMPGYPELAMGAVAPQGERF